MSAVEKIEATLARHEYALGLRRGSVCLCGFVPEVDPGSLKTQQDYHRAHLVAEISSALGQDGPR